jgi:hypothetical protein
MTTPAPNPREFGAIVWFPAVLRPARRPIAGILLGVTIVETMRKDRRDVCAGLAARNRETAGN